MGGKSGGVRVAIAGSIEGERQHRDPTIFLGLMIASLLLAEIDLMAPRLIAVISVEALVMAWGGWVLRKGWGQALLVVIACDFLVVALSGDEEPVTTAILFVVTALIGLTANELADSVRQRQLFARYLADQLRVPVTLMRGYLSMTRDGDIPLELGMTQLDKAVTLLVGMLDEGIAEGKRFAGGEALRGFKLSRNGLGLRRAVDQELDRAVWYGIGVRTTARVAPSGQPSYRKQRRRRPPVTHQVIS